MTLIRVIFRNGKFTDVAVVLSAFQQDPYIASMEHHTDWVNDIVLCCNGKTREHGFSFVHLDTYPLAWMLTLFTWHHIIYCMKCTFYIFFWTFHTDAGFSEVFHSLKSCVICKTIPCVTMQTQPAAEMPCITMLMELINTAVHRVIPVFFCIINILQ